MGFASIIKGLFSKGKPKPGGTTGVRSSLNEVRSGLNAASRANPLSDFNSSFSTQFNRGGLGNLNANAARIEREQKKIAKAQARIDRYNETGEYRPPSRTAQDKFISSRVDALTGGESSSVTPPESTDDLISRRIREIEQKNNQETLIKERTNRLVEQNEARRESTLKKKMDAAMESEKDYMTQEDIDDLEEYMDSDSLNRFHYSERYENDGQGELKDKFKHLYKAYNQ